MKKRSICEALLGAVILAATLGAYAGHFDCMGEYCFVSGITAVILFFSSAVYREKTGKSFPDWIYADCSVATLIITIATIALGLNLNGAFIFVHIADPVLIFAYWAYFCDHRDVKNKMILTTAVFPVLYTILAAVILKVTGNCPFPASMALMGHTLPVTVLCLLSVYLLFIAIGFAYHFANRAVRSKLVRKAST